MEPPPRQLASACAESEGVGGPDELRALGRLAARELRGAVGGIHAIHHAVSTRGFAAAGPGAAPTRAIHDAIAASAYGAVAGSVALTSLVADAALARRAGAVRGRGLSRTRRGAAALAILGGLIGDELERDGSELQEPMSVRVGGLPVALERGRLRSAFPDARSRVVVFLHGLCESEHSWRGGAGPTYAARLAAALPVTPIEVRYNSGRHISANGRSLSELLEALLGAWPVEVGEIALVGHSMGGLVARSAGQAGSDDGAEWVRRVGHVVSLGSPHLGAPLAQAGPLAAAALAATPETRPLGALLRRGSAGMRDLRDGSLVDADWRGGDPHALRAAACREVPLLPGATHHFVAATITRDKRNPLGRLLGDWLVLEPSASGRGRTRRIPFRPGDGLHVGGASHLALLNHPVVADRLVQWLAVTR